MHCEPNLLCSLCNITKLCIHYSWHEDLWEPKDKPVHKKHMLANKCRVKNIYDKCRVCIYALALVPKQPNSEYGKFGVS